MDEFLNLEHKVWEKEMAQKYPTIFCDLHGDKRVTCMAFGIAVSRGWYKLLDDTCGKFQDFMNSHAGVEIQASQIKEKFGGLRFYIAIKYNKDSYSNDEQKEFDAKIYDIVGDAESKSESICEECGEYARIRGDLMWKRCLCESHYELSKK